MIHNPIEILDKFPIRKTNKQKTAFIAAVTEYASKQHYAVNVESSKRGARNIVIGDPQKARYLVTAHYDTPASIGLPNVITPNNPVSYILIQFLLVAILLAVSVGLATVVYVFTKSRQIAFLIWYAIYFGLLILMLKGPANRHNANDNTSGVVTVLEILSALPTVSHDEVCFVLFDLEEAGLVGSAHYRMMHKDVTEEQIVLNLDCVGDGNVIQFVPVHKARKNQVLLDKLSQICGNVGSKELCLRNKGFRAGSSDHKRFPQGVGIMAFRYMKGVGLYCGRIHTWRDTILDYENVMILRDRLIDLITEDAADKKGNVQ